MDMPFSIWMYICFPICLIGFTWMLVQGLKEVPPVSKETEEANKH